MFPFNARAFELNFLKIDLISMFLENAHSADFLVSDWFVTKNLFWKLKIFNYRKSAAAFKIYYYKNCNVNELFKEILISNARPRVEWKQGLSL